jgi:hypothetical protein
MSERKTSASPFDESALRALFDEVEPPPTMETRWRARVVPGQAPPDLPDAPRIRAVGSSRPQGKSWLRALGAAVAAMAVGGGIIGVAAVNRQPAPDPLPPRPTVTETTTDTRTTSNSPPQAEDGHPATVPSGPPGSQPTGGPTAGPASGGGPAGTAKPAVPPPSAAPPGPPAPARGPLAEWPDPANSGVPAGTALQTHSGDLHVTQAGVIIADMLVNGSVYVEAPGVTLRRVRVAPSSGAYAGVRQLSQAPGLRIEDSEVSVVGGTAQYGVRQEAAGLVVQRSDIRGSDSAVAVTSDTTIVDSYLPSVQTRGNTARLTVRHNTISTVTALDEDGPVTDVTIENNQLRSEYGVVIFAPSGSGSRDIRVTGNQFRRGPSGGPIPCSGWNDQAPGNIWTGNVWFGTSEPVYP